MEFTMFLELSSNLWDVVFKSHQHVCVITFLLYGLAIRQEQYSWSWNVIAFYKRPLFSSMLEQICYEVCTNVSMIKTYYSWACIFWDGLGEPLESKPSSYVRWGWGGGFCSDIPLYNVVQEMIEFHFTF